MPRWLRSLMTGVCFVGFSLGGVVLTLIVLPAAKLLRRDPRAAVRGSFRAFLWVLWATGVGRFTAASPPPDLPSAGPYVIVANHPTLVDVVFLLATVPNLCCVVHPRLFRSLFVGPAVRASGHIRGPAPDDPDAPPVLDAIVTRLSEGVPVLIFPEGTRSPPWSLRRLKRGAAEAALRADVPLVPVFLACDPPALMKGQKWWEVPDRRFHLTLDYLPVIRPAGDSRSITAALKEQYAARLEAARVTAGAVGPAP